VNPIHRKTERPVSYIAKGVAYSGSRTRQSNSCTSCQQRKKKYNEIFPEKDHITYLELKRISFENVFSIFLTKVTVTT
jgi:hypothetical protein